MAVRYGSIRRAARGKMQSGGEFMLRSARARFPRRQRWLPQ